MALLLKLVDVCMNLTIKTTMKELYLQWMATVKHKFTPTKKIKQKRSEQPSLWIKSGGHAFHPHWLKRTSRHAACLMSMMEWKSEHE
jgi:hypothetical protein